MGKHGLTKNRPANGNTVEATNQLTLNPCLHTVCMPRLVKRGVGLNHGGKDPRSGLATTWCASTGGNDVGKGGVETHFTPVIAGKPFQYFAHGPVQSEVWRTQYHAWIRTPPQDGLPVAEPRENASSVGSQQGIDIQVTASSE